MINRTLHLKYSIDALNYWNCNIRHFKTYLIKTLEKLKHRWITLCHKITLSKRITYYTGTNLAPAIWYHKLQDIIDYCTYAHIATSRLALIKSYVLTKQNRNKIVIHHSPKITIKVKIVTSHRLATTKLLIRTREKDWLKHD